ncbi:MAG: DUF1795 domain-containing protein [Anaerolineae bacterium]|jgi:hypothetical protein|nr:DUF1795 domain-containing protein [Anaerolineae bacterium]
MTNIETMTWMEFRGPTFNLQIPSDWFISSNAQLQAIFLGPEINGLHPNLSISMRAVLPEVTPTSVASEALKSQQTSYAEFEVIQENDYTQTGGSAFVRDYRWRNVERQTTIRQLQAFFVYNQMLYTLTATAADEIFPEFGELFFNMISSFRIRA